MARAFAVVSPPSAFRAALLVLAAGVAVLALRAQSKPLTIKGSLAYVLRIALSPDSRAIVELRDVAAPDGASVLAEQRIALEGRQWSFTAAFPTANGSFSDVARGDPLLISIAPV